MLIYKSYTRQSMSYHQLHLASTPWIQLTMGYLLTWEALGTSWIWLVAGLSTSWHNNGNANNSITIEITMYELILWQRREWSWLEYTHWNINPLPHSRWLPWSWAHKNTKLWSYVAGDNFIISCLMVSSIYTTVWATVYCLYLTITYQENQVKVKAWML